MKVRPENYNPWETLLGIPAGLIASKIANPSYRFFQFRRISLRGRILDQLWRDGVKTWAFRTGPFVFFGGLCTALVPAWNRWTLYRRIAENRQVSRWECFWGMTRDSVRSAAFTTATHLLGAYLASHPRTAPVPFSLIYSGIIVGASLLV